MSAHGTLLATSLDNIGADVATVGESAWGTGASDSLPVIVGNVISVLLGILGIIFLVLVVYAGFLYLTAQGEDAQVKKAKAILTKAVIGILLVMSSYAITNVVVDAMTKVTTT
jgi:hypothetical protein